MRLISAEEATAKWLLVEVLATSVANLGRWLAPSRGVLGQ